MHVFRSLTALALAAAALAFTSVASAARIYPAWSFASSYTPAVDPGFKSVAGTFSFPLGGDSASVALAYDEQARIAGAGIAGGLTIFSFAGSFTVDAATGEQHVHLADPAKRPLFTFDGIVSPTGADIAGTFTKADGYLDYPGAESGPLTLHRTSAAAQAAFTLTFATRMDDHGRIRGKLAVDGTTDTRGSVAVYGGRSFAEGKIKGKVKTDANALTTGVVTIVGRGWRAKLAGPIDAAGFHASCDIAAAGFSAAGASLLLAVQPGPVPPDTPTKPPRNLLSSATATIVNGQVTITHTNVPSKFFGATAGLTIQFPYSDGVSVVSADVASASTATPRRCIVTVGGKTYGTAMAPIANGVTLDIRKVSSVRDGVIEVLATGRVYPVSGTPKSVNVLVQAVVQ
jgi:hypothetical protein